MQEHSPKTVHCLLFLAEGGFPLGLRFEVHASLQGWAEFTDFSFPNDVMIKSMNFFLKLLKKFPLAIFSFWKTRPLQILFPHRHDTNWPEWLGIVSSRFLLHLFQHFWSILHASNARSLCILSFTTFHILSYVIQIKTLYIICNPLHSLENMVIWYVGNLSYCVSAGQTSKMSLNWPLTAQMCVHSVRRY